MRKFNINYNERTNTNYFRNFEEIERLPEIGDTFDGREVIEIKELSMDCEQPHDENFLYDLYKIICKDEDADTVECYVCMEKEISAPIFRTLSYVLGADEEIQIGHTYYLGQLWDGDGDRDELLESGTIAVYSEDGQDSETVEFRVVEPDEDVLKVTVEVTDIY